MLVRHKGKVWEFSAGDVAYVLAMATLCVLGLAGACATSGCSAQATSPGCVLRGNYLVTTDGCGATFVRTQSMDQVTECRDGDSCEPGEPSAFCSFVNDAGGCDLWTTFERVEQ